MTNPRIFKKRKGRVFLSCVLSKFQKEGLENFLDIVFEAETDIDRDRKKRLESLISAFPKYYSNAANNFNENLNVKNES
jgi:hypothetical protein